MNNLAKEIYEKINTQNQEVLTQSLNLINYFHDKEIQRGKSANSKLNSMLTLLGFGSALLLFFGNFLFSSKEIDYDILIKILFIFSTSFFIKSIFY